MISTNRETAKALQEQFGFRIFSSDYDILTLLHESGESSHTEINSLAYSSPATLRRRLATLSSKGLIEIKRGKTDRRHRSFALTEKTRIVLEQELAFFSAWPSDKSEIAPGLNELVGNLQRRLSLPVLGPEYKIVLGAYANNGVTTLSLLNFSQLSLGGFFKKLERLKKSDIVLSVRNDEDHRKIQLAVSDWALAAIDDAHADLSKWASSLAMKTDIT